LPEFRFPVTNVSPNARRLHQDRQTEAVIRPLAVAAGMLLVLAVTAALTVHAHPGRIVGLGHTGNTAPKAKTKPPVATTAPASGLVPRAGQVLVTGTVTSLTATYANGSPLKPPFTISVPTRGQGGASITGVQVGGRTVAISWYAGQPLPVAGSGTLNLSGAPVTINSSGITWSLDGAARQLTAGRFFLGAPVAVGGAGLAQSFDTVTLVAGPTASIETTGGATAHLPPAAVHLVGPGRLSLQGHFTVRSPKGVRTVNTVTLGAPPLNYSYSIDLVPTEGGFATTDAILQGPVSEA
jgi:hypothetical protein